ncbi:hypothetical protein NO932_11875 [Pelagibacterium sp. 26DY04]|uniref:hypothetical protein n=1 Tax=Pelagibacterium sp. 26DY04 TaxID=2967130 RepID=UPI0028159AA4|nr:hypothetical protein [Pelagibacterium sp. 26DY04]WMT85626.1 hypothetical protein NO932_11875 [Pelagibacterium sp. 26DY04]
MHLRKLFFLCVLIIGAVPGFAQEIDEDLVAPVPPPRPAEFGGSAPAADEDSGDDPSIVIDGTELDAGPDAQPDFSGITDPQPVTLSARLSDDGPFIPDGLVWRVFDTRTDANGELALVAKSEEATASLSLPPGEYIMHVAYGRAQASDRLFVEPGPNTHTMVFEVGGLQLAAMITGDVPIPDELLRFDIYSDGPNGRVTIAENVSPNELIHLNAGIYSIVSRFGPINAVVRSELRVESGQITEATLYHKAAQVALRLVSEEGGEAIADVEWTIQTPEGETIFSDIGAFPATVLAEGDYLALAKLGENVYNREFEIVPGSPREVEILTTVY